MSDDLVTEYAGDGTWSEESEWDYADLEAEGEGEALLQLCEAFGGLEPERWGVRARASTALSPSVKRALKGIRRRAGELGQGVRESGRPRR